MAETKTAVTKRQDQKQFVELGTTEQVRALVYARSSLVKQLMPQQMAPRQGAFLEAVAFALSNQDRVQSWLKEVTRDMTSNDRKVADGAARDLLAFKISVIKAIVSSARLGLFADGMLGHAYVLPFGQGQSGLLAQLIIGYKGYLVLGSRSRSLLALHPEAVFTGEDFRVLGGSEPRIDHEITINGKMPKIYANMVAAYCSFDLRDGGRQHMVLDKGQIEAIKARSPGAKSSKSPWNSPVDAVRMAMKSAIRAGANYIPFGDSEPLVWGAAVETQQEYGRPINVAVLDIEPGDVRGDDWSEEEEAEIESRQQEELKPEQPEKTTTAGALRNMAQKPVTRSAESSSSGSSDPISNLRRDLAEVGTIDEVVVIQKAWLKTADESIVGDIKKACTERMAALTSPK